jgi:hypothetical protein
LKMIEKKNTGMLKTIEEVQREMDNEISIVIIYWIILII